MFDQLKLLLSRKADSAIVSASIIAQFLNDGVDFSNVDLYGCGSIGKALVENRSVDLPKFNARFVQTNPDGMTFFEGIPVVSPEQAVAEPADILILLSDLYDKPMRACLNGYTGEIFGLKQVIATQDISSIVAECQAQIRGDIAVAAREIKNSLSGRPMVAFVSEYPFLHTFKIMKEIRNMGYFVLLCIERENITSSISVDDYSKAGCFDAVYKSEMLFPLEIVELLNTLSPQIIHAETGAWSPHGLGIAIEKLESPVIVDYRDIFEMLNKSEEQARSLLGLSVDEYAIDVMSRKSIFTNAAGVIYKEDTAALTLVEDAYQHKAPVSLQYLPYMQSEHINKSGKSGGRGIVYAGTFTLDPDCRISLVCKSMLDAAKVITAQGLHFSIYNSEDSSGDRFKEVVNFDKNNEFFHYHFALPYEQMSKRLTEYDYGWSCFDLSKTNETKSHNDYVMSSKIISYFEACLPILYSPELKFITKVVTEMGIGIPCSFDELDTLKEKLANIDRDLMVQRAVKNQYKWTHKYNIHKLAKLYQNVMKSKDMH